MISLAGVSKIYNGKRQVTALEEVNLQIKRGEPHITNLWKGWAATLKNTPEGGDVALGGFRRG
jgi:hypothetical protein